MPSFVVVKRLTHDREYMPGEILVDLDERSASILSDRGYITEVGDDIVQKHADATAEAGVKATVPNLVAQGYSEKAAEHIAKGTDPLPKYVQEEKAKIEAREARRADRTQAELDRLAPFVNGSADDVLDLSDEDYKDLLDEHPSPVPTEAADAASVGDGKGSDTTPFDDLAAMPKEDLLKVMEELSVAEPTAAEEGDDWFKNDNLREGVIRTILADAGYKGAAVEPTPAPADT